MLSLFRCVQNVQWCQIPMLLVTVLQISGIRNNLLCCNTEIEMVLMRVKISLLLLSAFCQKGLSALLWG